MKKILLAVILSLFLITASCNSAPEEDTGENALLMQQFVEAISVYARTVTDGSAVPIKPDFIIIPQNGAELAFNDTDPLENNLRNSYINAIDGIGIEELFYDADGNFNPDAERLAILEILKTKLKIMVSDYVSNQTEYDDSITRNESEGFIAFPRSHDNYNYELIPALEAGRINNLDVNTLADAKNYLYLISTPLNSAGIAMTKNEMLDAVCATDYDLVLIDSFFEGEAFLKTEIDRLKTKQGGGKRLVISYLNIGSAETFRYYWKPEWNSARPAWMKKAYEGYADEYWVEYWNPEWQSIIFGSNDSYLKKIIDAGFDGAYLDNVEAYYYLLN